MAEADLNDRAAFADFGASRPHAFVDAGRHTARVHFFKRAIVVACVSAAALIGFFVVFNPLKRLDLGFSVGRVGVEGTRIIMEQPKISGARGEGQFYEIQAGQVVQDTQRPRIFELSKVDARLGMVDGTTTRIQGDTGVYDSTTDALDLAGAVRIRNDGRYDMNLKSAHIDLKTGKITSDEGAVTTLPGGAVTAKSVGYQESEGVVNFSGRVRSTFTDKNAKKPQ
ncbi:MAG: LPS export ABC transporter periplasmic protein LptC [Hyphomicrobiales bacterium]|nr:LPS export ABC transporter periplasmic protein LptC [Hyphomicrobiales bacterium]